MKLASLVLALALVTAAFVVGPAAATTPTGATAQLDVLHMMGLETPMWMVPTNQLRPQPSPHPDFPLDCSDYDNSWCSGYRQVGCCCVAAVVAPGAYCGDICV